MRLQFIKQAQGLGISLGEVGEILKVRDAPFGSRRSHRCYLPCHEVKEKLEDKVTEIDQQIQALQHLQTQIKSLLAGADPILENPEDDRICPIIQSQ